MTTDCVHAEIGEMVAGIADGHRDEQAITLYKSVGVAVQDAAAAALVLRAAGVTGAGTQSTSDRVVTPSAEVRRPAATTLPERRFGRRDVAAADRLPGVPAISGRLEVNLTVRDLERSAAWYSRLLGMRQRYDFTSDDARMRYVCLVEPNSELVLCLVGHAANVGEEFSEFRTGLDHLEFLVDHRDDLDEWADRLDALGIPHSGIKNLDYTPNAMLTFRDPDNIQLEFFWRAGPADM